jgi:thiosulfate dehydrogenase (quinone) large subunit
MFSRLLRESKVSASMLVVLRLILGFSFLKAGFDHLTVGIFDASGFIKAAIANPVEGPNGDILYSWYVLILKFVVLPNVDVFNTIIPTGEFLIGIGLIFGTFTTAMAFFALVLNFSYVLAGNISSNPLDILMGIIILCSGCNAGRFGLDRWGTHYIQAIFLNQKNKAAGQKSH